MVRTPGFSSKGHFQSHLTSPARYLAAFPLLPHSVLCSSKIPSFFPGCPTPESSPGSSAWPPPSLHLACDPLPLGHWAPPPPFLLLPAAHIPSLPNTCLFCVLERCQGHLCFSFIYCHYKSCGPCPYWVQIFSFCPSFSLLNTERSPFSLSELSHFWAFSAGPFLLPRTPSRSLSDKPQVSLRARSDSIPSLHSLSFPLCLHHQGWSFSSMTSVPCLSLMRLEPQSSGPQALVLEPHVVRALMRAW